MVNRRFTQVATSDDDEDEAPPSPPPQRNSKLRKRKRMKLLDDEEEDNDSDNNNHNKNNDSDDDSEKEEGKKEPPQTPDDAKPIGDPIRVSGKGRGRKRHYESFEFDGNQYSLVSFVKFLHNLISSFNCHNTNCSYSGFFAGGSCNACA
jgi:hypothetical protein